MYSSTQQNQLRLSSAIDARSSALAEELPASVNELQNETTSSNEAPSTLLSSSSETGLGDALPAAREVQSPTTSATTTSSSRPTGSSSAGAPTGANLRAGSNGMEEAESSPKDENNGVISSSQNNVENNTPSEDESDPVKTENGETSADFDPTRNWLTAQGRKKESSIH